MSVIWNCLGDSITSNVYIPEHYYTYIEKDYDVTVRNYGICGTRIAGTGKGAFCNRYQNMLPADVITVYGGVNDWGQQNPTPLGDMKDETEETFYGALKKLCKGLKTEFPSSSIIFFTPIGNHGYPNFAIGKNKLGLTVVDYVDACIKVCSKFQIPVVDLYRECGFSPDNEVQNKQYFLDGLHLNCEGHKKISTLFLAAMEEYYGKLPKKQIECSKENQVDVFLFMGQSNMSGRGIVTEQHKESAPKVTEGAGFEFRAISDPSRLYPLEEPFGFYENNPEGTNEPNKRTGSMTASFVNAYYEKTRIPVVGVAAAKGGSSILEWQPNGAYLIDTSERIRRMKETLHKRGYLLRHIYMAWCQGETDADHLMSRGDYKRYFDTMLSELLFEGVEECFLITIGHYDGAEHDYTEMIDCQINEIRSNPNVVLVSTDFTKMRALGLMKDPYHYFQEAYNRVGEVAGANTAYYVMTGLEPEIL